MSIRVARVQNDLLRALGLVFVRNNLQYVDIHKIYMSKDVRSATIEVGSLDLVINDKEMLKILNSRIGFIKKQLGAHIKLKYFPNIKFVLNTHKNEMEALEKLMKEVELETVLNEEIQSEE